MDPQKLIRETFVNHVVWLEETGSTNSLACTMTANDEQLPLLVGADLQTQGRGRNNHRWWGGPGALTFSLLIDPDTFAILPAHWPLLSIMTGLATCRTLERLLPNAEVRIKWPNDVYANGRKISGILLESASSHPRRVVLGIGINVNNSFEQAPEELRPLATSLIDLAGQTFDRETVLITVLNQLQTALSHFSERTAELIGECRERCYLTGRLVSVDDQQQHETGMCLGIDDDGALRIMTESGPQRFLTGTISCLDGISTPQ